jgi:hypothetical protein
MNRSHLNRQRLKLQNHLRGKKRIQIRVEARTWLNTEHGVSNSKLTNNQKIINEAAQLGFMITILNLKQ